jgi:hypothetical protein
MNPSTTTPGGHADIPDLSRVTFFDGQRLTADDLNDAAIVQRELRWLHNRSLHNWGIGLGFAVSGNSGDRQVQVGPGYAIDCRGREILLTEPLSQPVPARPGGPGGTAVIYYLVAAYPDDSRLAVLERREGECYPDGAVRLRERAAIYWKAQGEQAVETGEEIVLAQASVQNCRLAAPLSLDQRRTARPSQQPYVAAGATHAPGTGWQLWTTTDVEGLVSIVGVQAVVDTSEARFGATPAYHARVEGRRFFAGGQLGAQFAFLVDGAAFVTDPAPARFTLRVLMPRSTVTLGPITAGSFPVNPANLFTAPTTGGPGPLLDLVEPNWSVVWLGVEG